MSRFSSILMVMLLIFGPAGAQAAEDGIARFLKSCAWGMAGGALVGTVSLAFESKPSEHTINIARGASLGLYAGVLYGVVQARRPPPAEVETDPTLGWHPIWTPQFTGAQFYFRF